MLIKNRIKSAALTLLSASLIVIIAARFIAEPALKTQLAGPPAYFAGLIILLALIQIINMCFAVLLNTRSKARAVKKYKKLESEIDRIGIKTPLDFSFAMCNATFYRHIPEGFLFTVMCSGTRTISGKYIAKSILEFEKRFGRKPEGFESRDWNIISQAETAKYVNKDITDTEPADLLSNISPAVLEHFHITAAGNHSDAA